MSDPWPFIIVIIVLAFIGALISLSALLPPMRRLCRRSLAARGVAICTVGALSFVIGFGLLTRLNAEVAYLFGTMTIVDTFGPGPAEVSWPPEVEANKPYVAQELWVRLLIPPGVRQPCYTSRAWVCDAAEDVLPATSERWGWQPYLRDVGIGCVPAVTSGLLGWFFTRKRIRRKT